MGDVNFQAPASVVNGKRCSAESTGGLEWIYEQTYAVFGGPSIFYPRPVSERSGSLHGEWDKWIAGEPWFPRIGVAHGVYPYKVFLTGNYPSGTTWAWYPYESNGTTEYYLRLYNAGMTAGTYNFTVVVRDQLFSTTSVAVSLQVWAANDASILDHFRIYQQGAGGGGTGTLAAPFNSFSDLWGSDYNNTAQCPPNAIVILKGTATLLLPSITNEPNALRFHCGTNRPKRLIGAWGSAIEFDLTTSVKGFSVTAGDDDWLLKNFRISGQNATSTSTCTQIGQANFDQRCAFHDLTLADFDAADPGSLNISAFGGDGSTYNKDYLTLLGITLDNIYATSGSTNAGGISLMEVNSVLWDEITAVNCSSGGNRLGFLARIKHHSYNSEVRRFTALGGVQLSSEVSGGSAPLGFGGGGGDSLHDGLVVRYCNIDVGAANRAISLAGAGAPSESTYRVRMYFNTFVGILRLSNPSEADSQLHAYRNLIENSQTNSGYATLSTDWNVVTGEASVIEDTLSGTEGTLVDANGVPLLSSNYGYGHYLQSLA